MKKVVLLPIIFVLFWSCKEDNSAPENPSLSEIFINNSFTWETSRTVNFTIKKPTSGVIKLTDETGQTIYYKGFYNGLAEEFQFSVKIPSNITKLWINGETVELASSELTVNLTSKSSPDFKNGQNTRGLVSNWPMNENAGTVLNDQTGGNHGNIIGANWQTGIQGSALEFNGTSAWVEIPESSNLDIQEAITVCAWVITRENKTIKIAQKGDWDGYGLGQSKWTGFSAFIRMADETEHSLYWGQGVPMINVWYFLSFTYDGSIMSFYVNGQLKASTPVTGLLKNNSRPFSIGSDQGNQKFCNGIIDDVAVYNQALSQEEIVSLYNLLPNSDADGDGVLDEDDDYPNDPLRAFNNFYPASGLGSLAFEDLWPNKGDYDFNDLVLDYRFMTVTNANNFITEISTVFSVKAIGAGYKNGFGFQFDQNFPFDNIQVSGFELTENFISLEANGAESNQELTTIIVFDNASKHLTYQGGIGVNVDHDYPWVEPDTILIYLDFVDNTYTQAQIAPETWNPFLIVNGQREVEIHLANHPPTSLAGLSFFGTSDDHSIPDEGVYYKTINNLPWAIELPVSFDYPLEKTVISDAHLKFVNWALSSGTNFTDWYMDIAGYREIIKIY